jgi:hypothetical protein
MWDELAQGALVLADTRRLDDCFASVDFFERRQLPFVLARDDHTGYPSAIPAPRQAACNQRLVDACYLWAFASLTASPGARRWMTPTGLAAPPTIRRCGPWATNRLVGILHGCLAHRVTYQEQVAWPTVNAAAWPELVEVLS